MHGRNPTLDVGSKRFCFSQDFCCLGFGRHECHIIVDDVALTPARVKLIQKAIRPRAKRQAGGLKMQPMVPGNRGDPVA